MRLGHAAQVFQIARPRQDPSSIEHDGFGDDRGYPRSVRADVFFESLDIIPRQYHDIFRGMRRLPGGLKMTRTRDGIAFRGDGGVWLIRTLSNHP